MVNVIGAFQQKLAESLNVFLAEAAGNMVALLGLVSLFVIGYIIGWLVKKFVIKVFESLRLDEWLEEQNLSAAIGGKTISSVIGSLIKWSIIALFLARGVQDFEFTAFQTALEKLVIVFIPNLILAIIIGLIGLIIGRYVRNLIEVSMTKFRKVLGFGTELLIIYMAIVIALQQVGIPTEILLEAFKIGFGGFVLAIVIAVGMAFGLASIGDAKEILKKLKKSKPK